MELHLLVFDLPDVGYPKVFFYFRGFLFKLSLFLRFLIKWVFNGFHFQFSAVVYYNLVLRCYSTGTLIRDQLFENFFTFFHSTKNNILTVQSFGFVESDVKLGRVWIFCSAICHRQLICLIMFVDVVFILEGPAVDWLSSSPTSIGYIPSLDYETRDNPMENIVLIMKRFSVLSQSFFTGTKTPEILGCFRAI